VTAQTINALRKEGHSEEALELAREEYRSNPDDFYLQNAYGWAIHECLKKLAGEQQAQRIGPADAIIQLQGMLREYARLKAIRRPDLLHSMMLQKALKIGRDWPAMVRFLRWWDFGSFRDEDKLPFASSSGRAIPSLEMQAIYAVARSLADGRLDQDEQTREWAIKQVELGRQRHPADRWLPYYWCKWCLHTGQRDAARMFAAQVVVANRSNAWAWHLLALTCAEPADAILCDYRAILAANEPLELARVRIELAELLARESRFAEAAEQISRAFEERERLGFRSPLVLEQLAGSEWYREVRADSGPAAAEIEEGADDVLWAHPPPGATVARIGVLDHHNDQKGLSYVAFSANEGKVVPHWRFKAVRDWPLGVAVELLLSEDDSQVVRVRQTDAPVPDGMVQIVEGRYSTCNGQSYGFVHDARNERILVPSEICRGITIADGALVRCTAIRSLDKRRGVEGWKAATLEVAG
jgi:hypothetical protein